MQSINCQTMLNILSIAKHVKWLHRMKLRTTVPPDPQHWTSRYGAHILARKSLKAVIYALGKTAGYARTTH